ncbi:histone deacetylase family protein [Acidocella aromatica]|uniref:Acetoin utilization deacetylase AcuC-like enzyme n=1 Tax=Acidocella aromatica TaxID=1303579 RepID=A0A840VH98_9PROT|nr:histone deacetylase family protein [Acidocella aromatica]MBB5374267.1 acetoin utilization deacetylase AcuC-like enzyme [Acidocella aromatica]
MKIVYSADHFLHHAPGELLFGEFVPAFEKPERAELVLARVREMELGEVIAPQIFPLEPITRVHAPGLMELLQSAHKEWVELGRSGAAYPYTWPTRGMRMDRVPTSLDGRLAFYSFDCGTALTATSWQAIKSSVDVALTGATLLQGGERAAFSLCRPPGHHAGADHYGGYCFLNNAAIAAQKLLDDGAKRVAILDVDYHHGNGTQQIFYNRDDVFFVSLHGHPDQEYPYLLGFEDEKGAGKGEGYNLNFPLHWGTEWPGYEAALQEGIKRIAAYAPDVVVVSLGVDTYKDDPISHFKLEHEHFTRIGAMIKALNKPTLFVMEGGYAVAEIGINAVNVLTGFKGA